MSKIDINCYVSIKQVYSIINPGIARRVIKSVLTSRLTSVAMATAPCVSTSGLGFKSTRAARALSRPEWRLSQSYNQLRRDCLVEFSRFDHLVNAIINIGAHASLLIFYSMRSYFYEISVFHILAPHDPAVICNTLYIVFSFSLNCNLFFLLFYAR